MEKSGVGPQCASIITCNSKDKKKKTDFKATYSTSFTLYS